MWPTAHIQEHRVDRISVEEAKQNYADVIRLVAKTRQRFLLRDGKGECAAFVPTEDLTLLAMMRHDESVTDERVEFEELRADLERRIAAAEDARVRLVVSQDGREVAALIPRRDLELLEGLDGRIDIEAAKRLLDQQLDESAG